MNLDNIYHAVMRTILEAIDASLLALQYAALNGLVTDPTLAVGATATKFKVSAFSYRMGGALLSKTAANSIATPGASTAAGEFRKVLICIDAAGAVTTVSGAIAASQAAAPLPAATADTLAIGFLELPAEFVDGTTELTTPMCKPFVQSL